MKFKPILVLAGIFIIGFYGISYSETFRDDSGNPLDTPAGYIITQEAGTIDYKDNQGNSKPTVLNTTVETAVTAEYGYYGSIYPNQFEGWFIFYQNTSPGVPVVWDLYLTNEGNASFNVRATLEAYGASSGFTYTGGASNWTAYFVQNGSNIGGTYEVTLNDNDDEFFKLVIFPATDESNSPPWSTGTILFRLDSYGKSRAGTEGGGYYIGANGYNYGGDTQGDVNFRAKIYAPLMHITREAYVDSPTQYIQGGSHEAVPGAVITYILNYSNSGNGTAESVIIIGKVPDNCNACHVNASTNEVSNVYINPAKSTAKGWTVSYSTSSSPDKSYGATDDWTMLGTIESDSDYWTKNTSPDLPLSAKYVKFEKASVASGESETLTWGVVIR